MLLNLLPANGITLEAADNSAASILKRETRTAHTEAESSGFMHALLNPELELGAYISVLQQLYAVLVPIERRLNNSPYLVKFPSVEDRIFLTELEQDLAYYHALQTADRLALQRESSKCTPALNTLGATAGVLYVLEGAAYGGKLLSRIVANRLKITQEAGLRYFTLQAQIGVARIVQLKHELNQQLQGQELETAIRFANATFRSFTE